MKGEHWVWPATWMGDVLSVEFTTQLFFFFLVGGGLKIGGFTKIKVPLYFYCSSSLFPPMFLAFFSSSFRQCFSPPPTHSVSHKKSRKKKKKSSYNTGTFLLFWHFFGVVATFSFLFFFPVDFFFLRHTVSPAKRRRPTHDFPVVVTMLFNIGREVGFFFLCVTDCNTGR